MSRFAKFFLGNQLLTLRQLIAGQPDFIDITTPSVAGDELEVAHGLNRIPIGYAIVKRPYTGTAADHGESGDTEWTEQYLYLKFEETDVDMRIAVF